MTTPPTVARRPYTARRQKPQYDAGSMYQELMNVQQAIPVARVRTVLVDDVVQATDDTIAVDATAGAVTVTLPPANQLTYLRVTIYRTDASANAVLVGGALSPALPLRYAGDYVALQSTGTAWFVLGRPSVRFDVTLFGAMGNGINDDSAAIQRAIDACAAAGGGVIFFPFGTYKISKQTGRLSGMSAGVAGASLLLASSVTIEMDPGATLVQASADTDTLYGHTLSDARLLDIGIIGKGGADQGNAAELFAITGIRIEGCSVQSIGEAAGVGGGGFVLTDCDQPHVVDNRGTDCGYALINFFRCTNFVAARNTHTNTRGTSAGPVTCVYVDASSGQSSDGSLSDNTAIDCNYSYQTRGNVVRVVWSGNTATGELGFAHTVQTVGTDVAKDITLVGNPSAIAAGGLGGINFDGAQRCTADNNPVSGAATTAGISVNKTGSIDPSDIVISNNPVEGGAAGAFGILVSAGLRITLSENPINCPATGQRSIALTGGSKHVVRGNPVVAANFHAIDNTTDDCLIAENLIDGTTNGGDGIKSTGANCQVINNPIKGTIAGTKVNVSGAGSIVRDNPGYNPVGPSSPSVTASPMTYTNGVSPATLYVKGGTVSSVTTGGVTLASATDRAFPLVPNQAVIITYTVAPTLALDVQ